MARRMSSMSARRHPIWKSCWPSLIACTGTTKMKCVSSFTDWGYSTLTPYISRYFDTTTGSKTDSHSYQEIAKILCSGCHLRWFSLQTVTPELDGVQPAYGHCCACVQRIFRSMRANTD